MRRAGWTVAMQLAVLAGCTSDSGPIADRDTLVLGAQDLHVVGTAESIAHIEDVMPLPDGAAWVLNSADPFFVLLSSEGETLRVAGDRGDGPGEFRWPTTLVRDGASGAVLVYEPRRGRLLPVADEMSNDPALLRDFEGHEPLRLNSYDYLWTNNGGRTWLEPNQDGFVFAAPAPGEPWILSFWNTQLVRLRPGGEFQTIVSTADLVGDPAVRYPGASRFLPYPIWSSCPNGTLALYDPGRNQVRRFSPVGQEVRAHDLPAERNVAMSADRVVTTVYPGILRHRLMADPPEPEVVHEMFRSDYETRVDEFADVFPEYVHLTCSSPDTLWIQAFDTTAGQLGRGPLWLRVGSDGAVRSVQFPPSFTPLRFEEDRVWGRHEGDFDVEYLAWLEYTGS